MKKIISLLSALAVSASVLAGFATTSFALEGIAAPDSKPEIQAKVVSVDEGYARIEFKFVNNEELLPLTTGTAGKKTYRAVNQLTVGTTLSAEVFDQTEIWPVTDVVGGAVANGNFAFAPIAENAYMYTVNEPLFYIDALLNDGYDITNIPNDAITYNECILEYRYFNDSRTVTNYTAYGVNTTSVVDYPLTVKFTGTATDDEGDDEVKEFDTVVDQAVGTETYKGKYLKHIATVLTGADATKKVSISYGTETQVSGRTLAEILGGTAVDESLKVNAEIAIGVLTSDEEAVFTFDLVE